MSGDYLDIIYDYLVVVARLLDDNHTSEVSVELGDGRKIRCRISGKK